jgi:hypothetical protein
MHLYGVFFTANGRDKWRLTNNMRVAINNAKATRGLALMMLGPKYKWQGAWDAPTFRALADAVVVDYRQR